jgi:hypothetical protein
LQDSQNIYELQAEKKKLFKKTTEEGNAVTGQLGLILGKTVMVVLTEFM